jgi:hypothetical protein
VSGRDVIVQVGWKISAWPQARLSLAQSDWAGDGEVLQSPRGLTQLSREWRDGRRGPAEGSFAARMGGKCASMVMLRSVRGWRPHGVPRPGPCKARSAHML